MRIFAENANRDLEAGSDNQLAILTGLPAVLQACKSAIEAQRGEMQYDTTRGIPTSQTVWSGVPDLPLFRFYCLEALKAVSGVRAVRQFNVGIVDDAVAYEAVIVTEFGTETIRNIFDAV